MGLLADAASSLQSGVLKVLELGGQRLGRAVANPKPGHHPKLSEQDRGESLGPLCTLTLLLAHRLTYMASPPS